MNVLNNFIEVNEDRRLRWFGHFKRLGSDGVPKLILEWNVEGAKRKRKPREQ